MGMEQSASPSASPPKLVSPLSGGISQGASPLGSAPRMSTSMAGGFVPDLQVDDSYDNSPMQQNGRQHDTLPPSAEGMHMVNQPGLGGIRNPATYLTNPLAAPSQVPCSCMLATAHACGRAPTNNHVQSQVSVSYTFSCAWPAACAFGELWLQTVGRLRGR